MKRRGAGEVRLTLKCKPAKGKWTLKHLKQLGRGEIEPLRLFLKRRNNQTEEK